MQKEKKSTEALKHFLWGARHWREEADILSEEIMRLRSECEKMTSTFSDTPPTLDGYTDHRQQKYDEMIDKQREYAEKVKKCNERIQEIQDFVSGLYNYKEIEVCELFYIYMYDWQAVALKLNYSRRRIEQIHGKALLNLLELHKKIVENGGKKLF
jgi:DNA repair ATPase RecN